MEALISVLDPEADAMLQESGVDSICKLAAAADNRQKLLQQVSISAIIWLLLIMLHVSMRSPHSKESCTACCATREAIA